jgi:acylphosphatase
MQFRAHVMVSGMVQGVFFRSLTKRKADSLNVKGWIRNLPDGRVEAVFEGEENAVKAIIDFCMHGPRGAVVADLNVKPEDFRSEFEEFKIRYKE